MTEMQERVRDLFDEMAEEMPRTAMLPRLDQHAVQVRWRRRLVLAAAVVTAFAVAVGIAAVLRNPNPSEPLPAERPPKLLRISPVETTRPGTATIAVIPTILNFADGTGRPMYVPAYVSPAAGGSALTVPGGSPWNPTMQRLSMDGTLLMRAGIGPGTSLLDLRTGRERMLSTVPSGVSELSPDNRRIASYIDDGVLVTNVTTGRTHTVRSIGTDHEERGGLGWAPDGRRLALHEPGGTRIVDGDGATLHRLPDVTLVNGSMSWSPSGRYVLGYDEALGSFVLASTDGEYRAAIQKPTENARLLGWAGPRLVWLVGDPGAQRLVTTDEHGTDRDSWILLPGGLRSIATVTWSSALSGNPLPAGQ